MPSRFIPTHVGNTLFNICFAFGDPVHPHACGEHMAILYGNDRENGSSPRMWGTLFIHKLGWIKMRFIPTHVGNTKLGHPNLRESTVHPHACGEHPNTQQDRLCGNGSSPRMWGTPPELRHAIETERFIPTHVGNTGAYHAISGYCTVHPHACGEHRAFPFAVNFLGGSSPRMWGTHQRVNVYIGM